MKTKFIYFSASPYKNGYINFQFLMSHHKKLIFFLILQVEFHLLNTIFMKDGTADSHLSGILESIKDAQLDLNNLLSLGMDGPNVNKSVLRKMNAELTKTRRKPVLDVGFCQLHAMHNAYRK